MTKFIKSITNAIPLFCALFLSAHADGQEINVIYNQKMLTPEASLMIAEAALQDCREKGAQVAVAVLDKGGHTQTLLRDQLAGFSTPDGAILKAKTAINFRTNTRVFSEAVRGNPEASGIRFLPDVLLLGGGIPIEASGILVGGIGVAGAPDGRIDDECAQAGIDAVSDMLEFAE